MPRPLSASPLVGGLLTLAGAALVTVILVALVSSPSATGPTGGSGNGPRALEGVEVAAGDVDVWVEPIRVDETGALFLVEFDTHSVELDLDIAGSSRLAVEGVEWSGVTWVGDPPGGHHRTGELFFESAGPANGRMILRIDGLSGPVVVEWDLGT
jgi:hypothetical protein